MVDSLLFPFFLCCSCCCCWRVMILFFFWTHITYHTVSINQQTKHMISFQFFTGLAAIIRQFTLSKRYCLNARLPNLWIVWKFNKQKTEYRMLVENNAITYGSYQYFHTKGFSKANTSGSNKTITLHWLWVKLNNHKLSIVKLVAVKRFQEIIVIYLDIDHIKHIFIHLW